MICFRAVVVLHLDVPPPALSLLLVLVSLLLRLVETQVGLLVTPELLVIESEVCLLPHCQVEVFGGYSHAQPLHKSEYSVVEFMGGLVCKVNSYQIGWLGDCQQSHNSSHNSCLSVLEVLALEEVVKDTFKVPFVLLQAVLQGIALSPLVLLLPLPVPLLPAHLYLHHPVRPHHEFRPPLDDLRVAYVVLVEILLLEVVDDAELPRLEPYLVPETHVHHHGCNVPHVAPFGVFLPQTPDSLPKYSQVLSQGHLFVLVSELSNAGVEFPLVVELLGSGLGGVEGGDSPEFVGVALEGAHAAEAEVLSADPVKQDASTLVASLLHHAVSVHYRQYKERLNKQTRVYLAY